MTGFYMKCISGLKWVNRINISALARKEEGLSGRINEVERVHASCDIIILWWYFSTDIEEYKQIK